MRGREEKQGAKWRWTSEVEMMVVKGKEVILILIMPDRDYILVVDQTRPNNASSRGG
jgi:hypothetical protein